MEDVHKISSDSERELLRLGGKQALAELLSGYQSQLERIVQFRLEPALQSRLDPGDILQEAYLEIASRLDEFVAGCPVSFFVWARQKTIQTMIDMQRAHLSEKRDAHREVALASSNHGNTSCLSIARYLMDDMTSPSQAVMRIEEIQQLQQALETMNETDREVLVMRHFEHLNNLQTAEALGISATAASNRYIRAAAKLSEILNPIQSKLNRHVP